MHVRKPVAKEIVWAAERYSLQDIHLPTSENKTKSVRDISLFYNGNNNY
jgi:hypothetical protein